MYHEPVLLKECIEGLNVKPDGVYVDLTFGGGGHARAILKELNNGTLLAFDHDEDANKNSIDDQRFLFIHQNFKHLIRYLKLHKSFPADGILADLGVSSHQIDTPERGFSTRFNGPLDMRMDLQASTTASTILGTYDRGELQRIFSEYGEVRNAKTLANQIVEIRDKKAITTIDILKEVIDPLIKGNPNRYLAQVFQALRIEVNDELGALREMLLQCIEALKPGGRMVVLSYHSCEDRLVKNFMRSGQLDGQPEKDEFGNITSYIKVISKKPIIASEDEIGRNPRARSAKLRIAEKINE